MPGARDIRYPARMQFDEKARENLEAVERLLPDDDGDRESLSNAAASRAYYAAYLAVAHVAQRRGQPFTDRRGAYYRHDRLADDAYAWQILDEDGSDLLRLLHWTRIKADYEGEHVSLDEASHVFEVARQLVHAVLAETSP